MSQSQLQSYAFVALGSNLGDSRRIIQQAIERLRSLSNTPLLCSSLRETAPVDCPENSPPFINAVVGFLPRPNESPQTLLQKLHALEREFGRQPKKIHNEPRLLDLDLIAFGSTILHRPELTIPHPRAHLRQFVIEPWNEIAPDFLIPGQNKSVSEIAIAVLKRDFR